MYKIELHLHTKYSSGCGQLDEKELISGYKAAGYSAIVVTDHYNRDTFRMKNKEVSCKVFEIATSPDRLTYCWHRRLLATPVLTLDSSAVDILD